MSLPILIIGALLLLSVLSIIFFEHRKKTKQLKSNLTVEQKNHQFVSNTLKEVISGIEYGRSLSDVVDQITKILEKSYSYSTLSSIAQKENTLIFNTQVKETVSHAFIDHIKDVMLASLDGALSQLEVTQTVTGITLDDLGSSTLQSTVELKIIIGDKTYAIINLSSTSDNVYTAEDKIVFATLSELLSGILTKTSALVEHEKGNSLSMINSFSEGIFTVDTNLKLTAINDSAKNFLDIHNESLAFSDILASLPNTYNFQNKIDHAIREGKAIDENNVYIRSKIFKIVITPVVDTVSKNVIGASVLLHDKTLEQSLSQMKEDFTNIMVHELRSPLTAIRASSEFLTSTADLTTDEKHKLIMMISDSSKKMLEKISLILDSAKMDAGLFTIKKTQSDLKKLIQDRITTFTPVANEKFINLFVDVASEIPVFAFDPLRIDEVINNLLSNSLKFTPERGKISITAKISGDKVIVSVSDTGQGIAKDKQHLLFTKFQQGQADSLHAGTGLGLYVVKEVVESHGGTVSLVSEIGQGTTISFSLPLSESAQAVSTNPGLPKAPNPMSN